MPYDKEKNSQNTHRTSSLSENGSLILLWTIVIGALAMLITAVIDERISIAIAGLLLMISGCAAIATKNIARKYAVVFLLPIAGLAMTAISIYLILSEYKPETFPPISHEVRTTSLGLFAVIIGLCMIVIPVVDRLRRKRRCTCEVNAVCIYIDERTSRGIKCYAPEWKYSVNGKTYKHQEMISSLKRKPEVGYKQTLMVDPDAPDEIYRREAKGYLSFVVMGLCLAFAGGIILGLY